MYIELAENIDFSQVFPTWIIAYCPDTDSFFATNQRFFFWEDDNEFKSEDDAINYFREHLDDFRKTRNEILSDTGGWSTNSPMYLENTKENF